MRKTWLLLSLIVPVGVLGFFICSQAQPPTPPLKQASLVRPAEPPAAKPRDGSKMPETAQPIFFSAHRAAEWLKRANKPDHRFVYGFQPALRVQLDGDNFASQAGATFALARASRYFRDPLGTTTASAAALALARLETVEDPEDKTIRYTAAPPTAVHRLSSHGALVLAIHELDAAEKYGDLIKYADQLCNYLRKQQRPDGSLFVQDGTTLIKSGADDIDAEHAGWALQGIIRSHKLRPADWKLEMLRKARGYYLTQWQQKKSVALVCSHTPAYAEAYLRTNDAAFRDAVYAMNDWLVGLQYTEDYDSTRKHWAGGFKRCREGKIESAAPDITSALPAESLVEACRVAKQAGDLQRLRRYERALIDNFHFLMALQYTPAKTQHFVDPFRPSILGAFHASHQDGNLRIDNTQHALCAMVQYLDVVIE